MYYNALIDAPTLAVLMLSQHVPIISFLGRTMPDTEHHYLVNFPNYIRQFDLAQADPKTLPGWKWAYRDRRFLPTPKELMTERLQKVSLLALKKGSVLYELIVCINTARNSTTSGLSSQETIYLNKKREAQQYKDTGYLGEPLKYPYVLQYSDYSGLSMREAADEILFKAKLDDELLLKSEFFRLKYFNLLKAATELPEVENVITEFRRELYRHD